MNTVYLLLGSNLGKRRRKITEATDQIRENLGFIKMKSAIYESEPWGFEDETNFFNQVVVIETLQSAAEILEHIKKIEEKLGRKRVPSASYISRTIDIDILFYNKEIYKTNDLTIPHPLMQERMFALLPLAELSPQLVHPGYQKTIIQLLEECPDKGEIRKVED